MKRSTMFACVLLLSAVLAAPDVSAKEPGGGGCGGCQGQGHGKNAGHGQHQGMTVVLERLETVTRTGPTLLLDVRAIPGTAELPWLAAESVSISERWEPSDARVRVGESITRNITIEASGLIGASIPELSVESPRGFRTYPQTADISEQVSGDDLVVTARIRRSYVPTLDGELELPAVRLPWWSIGMDEPREASLPARLLQVHGAPSPAVADGDQHARLVELENPHLILEALFRDFPLEKARARQNIGRLLHDVGLPVLHVLADFYCPADLGSWNADLHEIGDHHVEAWLAAGGHGGSRCNQHDPLVVLILLHLLGRTLHGRLLRIASLGTGASVA